MKSYQSTKIVKAAPIVEIAGRPIEHSGRKGLPDHELTHLTVEVDGEKIAREVPSNIATRYWPLIGDYLVEYEDGYLSISPKKTFEEGYVLI